MEERNAGHDVEDTRGYQRPTNDLSKKDRKWLDTVIEKGTLMDKISSLAILAQQAGEEEEATNAVQQLLSMVKRTDRRVSQLAMNTLQDLFLSTLLPKKRVLNIDNESEATIRNLYSTFIRTVSEKSRDNVLNSKQGAIKTLGEIAVALEQQSVVISELVNKLGDNEKQACSLASHLLITLTKRRPLLKPIILEQIEKLIFRPNVSTRAQFYAVVFMTGISLDLEKDKGIAERMIKICFALVSDIFRRKDAAFRDQQILEKSQRESRSSKNKKPKHMNRKKQKVQQATQAESADNRLLSTTLVCISQIVAVYGSTFGSFSEHLDELYRSAHSPTITASTRALLLLFRLLSPQGPLPDRFLSSLYSILASPQLPTSSHSHATILSIVFNTLKTCTSLVSSAALVKRLLQTATLTQPTFTTAALMLVGELCSDNRALLQMLLCAAEGKSEIVWSGKRAGAASAESADDDDYDQVALSEESQKEEAILEEEEKKPVVAAGKKSRALWGDDSSEHFVDVDDDQKEEGMEVDEPEVKKEEEPESHPVEHRPITKKPTSKRSAPQYDDTLYDPFRRNPRFSRADVTCLWELSTLSRSSHPSVSHLSKQILEGGRLEKQSLGKASARSEDASSRLKVNYEGDPFADYSLFTFLARFSSKNPKSHIESGPEEASKETTNDIRTLVLQKTGDTVAAPDEQFLFDFFDQNPHLKTQRKKKKKKDGDESEVGEDELDDYLAALEADAEGAADVGDDLDGLSELSWSDDDGAKGGEDDEGEEEGGSEDDFEGWDDAESGWGDGLDGMSDEEDGSGEGDGFEEDDMGDIDSDVFAMKMDSDDEDEEEPIVKKKRTHSEKDGKKKKQTLSEKDGKKKKQTHSEKDGKKKKQTHSEKDGKKKLTKDKKQDKGHQSEGKKKGSEGSKKKSLKTTKKY
ncbi:putative CCAAT/enhancer-binding protein zeta [Blattamonas nauphoetae]|uniref:CCAAT/enhancer-binding protein zeta n=1 Tax=Blattamonas nauphoetae TaxID=2049346 RepID=A0ABQ9X0X8_9EUKA|nr:putative CCAAT/enhancer-binding protein zeta [Blattamonas nauphoetae]